MIFEASNFDESQHSGEYGLEPVGPEVFEGPVGSEPNQGWSGPMSDDEGAEPLSTREEGAWERTIDLFDEPLFPALEELNEINQPLAALVGDMYRTARSEAQRQDAMESLEEYRSNTLNCLQEVLCDMQEHMGASDEFFSYAAELICNHTAERAALLNEQVSSAYGGRFLPAKQKKILRMIAGVWEIVEDDDEIPEQMVHIYADMFDNHMYHVEAILREAYRDHDRGELLHRMGEVVGLLQQIADTISPATKQDTDPSE